METYLLARVSQAASSGRPDRAWCEMRVLSQDRIAFLQGQECDGTNGPGRLGAPV